MLFDQRLATNSPEVLKKYTELVDLLSRARDINNYLILTANIGEVRRDVAQNRQELIELRRDFTALRNSLNELRNDILPALKAELEGKMNQVRGSLAQEVRDRQAAISTLQGQIAQERDARQMETMQLRLEMDQRFLSLRNELNSRINQVNENLRREVEAIRTIANSNLTLIRGIQESILVLNQRVRETSDQLRSLSDRVTQEIRAIQGELNRIRTEGNANYQEMVANWQCSEDMIGRGGFEFYGNTAFTRLGLSVSQACIQRKEDVLFSICTERYPAFCGSCRGYNRASDCPAWTDMSGRDRIEILLNIRQEVAIHYLNQQSKLQGQAIYGGESCKVHCLTGVNDSETQNILSGLINSGTSSSGTCGQDEWKNCGLYGVAYSLAINDRNLANIINEVNVNLSSEIAKLRSDFESEKRAVASRFGILEEELNQKINQLKQVTESRFMQIVRSMAGLSTASGPELAQDLANRSAYLAELASRSASKKDLVIDAIARAMGVSNETAKASLLEREKELINLLSSGIAVSSFDVLTEIFKTLDPNQNQRPFYDLDFQTRVAPSCNGHVRYTPFTNIVGRDTHEILAMAYMRLLLGGIRSNQASNNSIFFNLQGVVSGNSLQQVMLARLFDYRANPETEVSATCLNAIDTFARDILLNDARFANQRLALSQNLTLQRMATLLVDDAKKAFDRAGAIHGIIVGSAGANRSQLDANLLLVANRIVDAAIAERLYNLVNVEVENLIAIQKELSSQNGFQNEFEGYLRTYLDSMAAMRTGLEQNRLALVNEIAQRQAQDQALQAQIGQLRDAMGYVAALAMTDPLASEEVKRRVQAAATIDSNIQNLIQNINQSGRNEEPFTPVIRAIRHVTQGKVTCFGTQVSADVMPSGSAFVGHWGIIASGNVWSNSCAYNFRLGNQFKDRVLYRIWGSAHKIEFKSAINNSVVRTVDFRQPASMEFPIRNIVTGNFKQGVFDAQVPGILDPAVGQVRAYNTGLINLTPIFVSPVSGAEIRGTTQTYAMTLYSPIVLDFVNKGMPKTISPSESSVEFDLSAIGMKQRVGWISGREGGLLGLDLNGNGKIDDGSELFGEFTKMHQTGLRAANGYEALKQYDYNQDGRIDSKDPIFGKLVVWFDHNVNGTSEASELQTLSELKVSSIEVRYSEVASDQQFSNGNRIRYQAKFFGPESCGTSGCRTYDIYFGTAWQDQSPKVLSQK
jgi:DNA-binding transcriptional regulator YdaS (Cro superfamily)